MGTLRTRILLFLLWLATGGWFLLGLWWQEWSIVIVSAALFFGLSMGMGVILFGDPLPPKEGQVCKDCRRQLATVSKNYWAQGYTFPSGSVLLCDKCAWGYDPNRDWSR